MEKRETRSCSLYGLIKHKEINLCRSCSEIRIKLLFHPLQITERDKECAIHLKREEIHGHDTQERICRMGTVHVIVAVPPEEAEKNE
jgi:hypothetical protein